MTRALIQAEVELEYFLALNSMIANTEQLTPFGPFPSREDALAFYDAEKVEPYTEPGENGFTGLPTTWGKTFRKGGPLEWMNPLTDTEREAAEPPFGRGVHERLGRTYNVQILNRF